MHSFDRRTFFRRVTAGSFGLLGSAAAAQNPSRALRPAGGEDGLQILAAFDGGKAPPWVIEDNTITFDCQQARHLNVVVRRAPARLRIRLLLEKREATYISTQGLITSLDGKTFTAAPFAKSANGAWETTVEIPHGEIRLATRYPFGRDGLDRLICETVQSPNIHWRCLSQGPRVVPVFELGQDDGRKPIHFLIAGEDPWETAGELVAEAMVRTLCANRPLADKLRDQAVVRIVPLISPYSATQTFTYTGLDGKEFYAAARWPDPAAAPEIALLRHEVEEAIRSRRLGFMMTLHSWHSMRPTSTLQTIASAGANTLAPARVAWARRVMDAMMKDVPKGATDLREKIWTPGLARDYLLARHNVVTFRIEITTRGQGLEGFRQTGRQMIENLSALSDWAPVCRV